MKDVPSITLNGKTGQEGEGNNWRAKEPKRLQFIYIFFRSRDIEMIKIKPPVNVY
jgi:hypothetical protein